MARTVRSKSASPDKKTLTTIIAAVLVLVLVIGAIALIAGNRGPSKEQIQVEGPKALEKAAQLVNSGQAAGGATQSGGEQTGTR